MMDPWTSETGDVDGGGVPKKFENNFITESDKLPDSQQYLAVLGRQFNYFTLTFLCLP